MNIGIDRNADSLLTSSITVYQLEAVVQYSKNLHEGINSCGSKWFQRAIHFDQVATLVLGFRLCRHLCGYFSDRHVVKTSCYPMGPSVFAQKL
jgi:hypothetical protein